MLVRFALRKLFSKQCSQHRVIIRHMISCSLCCEVVSMNPAGLVMHGTRETPWDCAASPRWQYTPKLLRDAQCVEVQAGAYSIPPSLSVRLWCSKDGFEYVFRNLRGWLSGSVIECVTMMRLANPMHAVASSASSSTCIATPVFGNHVLCPTFSSESDAEAETVPMFDVELSRCRSQRVVANSVLCSGGVPLVSLQQRGMIDDLCVVLKHS